MTFGFLVRSRNFFWVSWEVLVFYMHGTSVIVTRFTFFTKNFVIRCNQVTKMFCSGHDCTSTSSVIFVFKQISQFGHCAYPNLVPLLLAAPLEVHEVTWKCLYFLALGFPEALLKYFHQSKFPWIPVTNQAIHAIYLFVLLLITHS